MEKKVTRRIIGVLVVVALVIILLPLVNINDSQTTIQTAEVKAPPFPDPQSDNSTAESDTAANSTTANAAAPVTAENTAAANPPTEADNKSISIHSLIDNAVAPQAAEAKPAAAPSEPEAANKTAAPPQNLTLNQAAPETKMITPEESLAANHATDAEEEVEQAESDNILLKDATVAAENNPPKIDPAVAPSKPQANAAPAPAAAPNAATKAEAKVEPVVSPKTVNKADIQTKASNKSSAKPDAPDLSAVTVKHKTVAAADDEIIQAKHAAWVVQLGSFKNKVNAERLTNSLRAKGYKAFTYETKSNGQTRVYVGPQFKQLAAAHTATKIETDMKMHGIVVSFKPLEL